MTNFFLRRIIPALSLGMLLLTGHTEEVTIVADLFTAAPATLEAQALNISFEEYVKNHPNVRIKPFTQLQVAGAGSKSGKLMAVAGETPPDVWRMFFHEVLKYSEQGFVMPLNKFIFDDGGKVIYEPWNSIPEEFKAGCMKDGQVYALPFALGIVQAMNYRTDLFRQAGLDPNQPPLTWEQLWYYARKLTYKPGEVPGKPKGQSGLYFMNPGFLCFNPMVWAAGGELVRKHKIDPKTGEKIIRNQDEKFPPHLEKESERWFAAFNSPEGLRALEFIHKLRWQRWAKDPANGEPFDLTPEMLSEGNAAAPSGQKIELNDDTVYVGVLFAGTGVEDDKNIYKVIAEGRIGMFFGYNSNSTYVINQYGMSPEQFGVGPMPAAPGCVIVGSDMPAMLGISVKKRRSPEAERIAWDIIRDFTSDENIVRRARILVEGGQGRQVAPAFLKMAGYHEIYESLPESWRNLPQLIRKNRTEPFNNGWTEVQAEITPAIVQRIYNDENIDLQKLLTEGETEANRRFESWPEEKLSKYRPLAWCLWGLGLTIFMCCLVYIVKSMTPRKVAGAENRTKKRTYFIYLTAVPAILSVLLWQYYPLIRGSVMAFQDYKIIGTSTWMGIDNFIMLFGDINFYYSMLRTFYYVGLTLLIGFLAPIALAILLTEIPRHKVLFRTLFYLPAVTSSMVVMLLWKEFYDPAPTGFLNTIVIEVCSWLGVNSHGLKWLADPKLAMLCVIIPGVWAGAGAGSLIYQAALTSVPVELYEAADVDGAGFWRKIFNITIPTLKPLIVINFVGVFIGAFHAMSNIFVMTGGGPFNATRVIGIDIWFNAFLYLKFGMSTAMAWVLGIMLIGFTVMQLKILSKVEFRKAQEN